MTPDQKTADRALGQQGELLIETLATLFLMATVLTAVISLTFSLVVAAWVQDRKITAGNLATSAAEGIDRLDYVSCGPSADFSSYANEAANRLAGEDSSWDKNPVVKVTYLQNNQPSSSSLTFGATCPAAGGTPMDLGMQRVEVTVKSTTHRSVTNTVVIYKRNTMCPLGAPTAAGEPC